MDNNEFKKKVIAILEKQQAAIKKMAQVTNMVEPAPMKLEPQSFAKDEAATVMAALKEPAKSAVKHLEVVMDEVRVAFLPGKGTQQAFDSLVKTVNELQQKNALPGASYKVKAVNA